MPYLRTEWAVQYPNVVSEAYAKPIVYQDEATSREQAERWNEVFWETTRKAVVVHRQISDWGGDE